MGCYGEDLGGGVFFKQKTAYGMRISDWSSDVCSSDLGYVASPVGGRNGLDPADFTTLAARNFIAAAEKWLTGAEPFTAKLHPEYAPYGDYDQLMRLDEWYGRESD